MAKQLRDEQPAASVSRILELSNAARGVMTPRPMPLGAAMPELSPPRSAPATTAIEVPPAAAASPATTAAESTARDLNLTPEANATFERLLEAYRRGTGTRMNASMMLRGILRGVEHCFVELEREARRIGRLKLPSNARGREIERDRFEARIADAFVAGVRSAAAFSEE